LSPRPHTRTHTTIILTDVIVDAGHVVQRCDKSIRLLMHCGLIVREVLTDIDYTFRLVSSGKRKWERPGSEEPQEPVALSRAVSTREQAWLDVQVARIDDAYVAASTRTRKMIKPEGLDAQERVGNVSEEAHEPDVKGKSTLPKTEMLHEIEATAGFSASGSRKCALSGGATAEEPVAGLHTGESVTTRPTGDIKWKRQRPNIKWKKQLLVLRRP